MSNISSGSSISYASFTNLFGIVVSIVLCVLFIILGGHTLKYIKAFACKIKIIVNKAEDKKLELKDFTYHTPKPLPHAFTTIEGIYKNEIKKSRSLQYWMLVRNLIAKYDHLLYYPFRDKLLEQYDLLKPKTTFYTLLVITSCCIAWMITIFLTAILQSSYSNVTLIPNGVFAGLTVAIAIISSLMNLIPTNRLFSVYLLNVKNAFKVDYGVKYLNVDEGLKEYEPENSDEEQELFQHHQSVEIIEIEDPLRKSGHAQNLQMSQITQRTLGDAHLNSTRKLLNEEFERSDARSNRLQEIAEEFKEDDEYHGGSQISAKKVRGKAIKDVFDLQVGIDGIDDAEEDTKYVFVEDRHAIGDMDLLYNEAEKGENKSNLYTFIVLFMIISLSACFCCYLNYTFAETLSRAVFYMFVGAFVGDILITRPLILMLIAMLKYLEALKKGYRKLQYKDSTEIKDALNTAIKDMFTKRKFTKEEPEKKGALKGKGDESADQYLTQNGLVDRQDTSMKLPKFKEDKEDEEDEEAHEVHDDDHFDGPNGKDYKIPGFHPTEYARPKIEDEQKKSLGTENQTQVFHAKLPLLNTPKSQAELKDFEFAAEKKQINNDLVDYNLMLLRKIFDAYEDRAERVVQKFRSDNNDVLRKRYMVPILNPNYDYEKLLKEMQAAGKGAPKDHIEEDEVRLEGNTVAGDLEKELMDAVLQEASDDLVP